MKEYGHIKELNMIEAELTNILECEYTFEMENRVQERIDNDTCCFRFWKRAACLRF